MDQKVHKCECGKVFSYKQGLSRHRQDCNAKKISQHDNVQELDYKQQIQQHQLEIQQLDYKYQLQIKELEYKHQLQIQELEYKYKLQIQELKYLLDTKPIEPIEQIPHVQNVPIVTMHKDTPKFCLKTYMNELKPILIDNFKSNYIPDIIDYDTMLTYGVVDGVIRNIIKYINQYTKNTLPIIVTNNQTARFRMYIYKKLEDDTINWCKYDGQEGLNIIEDIVAWLMNKYFRNMNVFHEKYPIIVNGISDENNMHIKESFISNLAKAEGHIKRISTAILDCFLINKD